MKFLRKRTTISVIQAPKKFDDEGSVGSFNSTFTADRLTKPSTDFECAPHKGSVVKFNLSNNMEYSSSFISEEEKAAVWYTHDEYKKFKSSFIELAREFHKYDRANPDPESFKIMLTQAFNVCTQASEATVEGLLEEKNKKVLQRWFSKGSRRGVERASVPSIFADKSTRRKRINAAVLEAQDQSQDMSLEDRLEHLREASEDISLTSRLFAWVLAI